MEKSAILKPLLYARVMDLYYHYCHNLTSGKSFSQDHALFAEFYAEMGLQYDRLAEYMIALFGNAEFSTNTINSVVTEELNQYVVESMSPDRMFEVSLKLEKDYYQALEELEEAGNCGIKNMVGDMCEKSDVRVYKIQQRLK